MAQYELLYFPVKGRGEAMRLLFVDNGINYTETDVAPFDRWQKEFKPQMAFGQVPCLKDGDLDLYQSNSILRYLGKKHGLYGTNDTEAVRIDMINDAVEDLRVTYSKMIYTNYEAGKQPFIDSLPQPLGYIENYIAKYGTSASGFSIGNQSSYADYNLADFLEGLTKLSATCLDAFPNLTAVLNNVFSRPAIAAYRETDAFKKRPRNGNNKE